MKELKPWQANLIVFGLELLELIIYFAFAGKAFKNALSGNVSGAFDNVVTAVWFINISALAIAISIFYFKPLRTKMNLYVAYTNLFWVASNIYFIYG